MDLISSIKVTESEIMEIGFLKKFGINRRSGGRRVFPGFIKVFLESLMENLEYPE